MNNNNNFNNKVVYGARARSIFCQARKVGPRIRARWTRGPTNATEACPATTVVPRASTTPPLRSCLGS